MQIPLRPDPDHTDCIECLYVYQPNQWDRYDRPVVMQGLEPPIANRVLFSPVAMCLTDAKGRPRDLYLEEWDNRIAPMLRADASAYCVDWDTSTNTLTRLSLHKQAPAFRWRLPIQVGAGACKTKKVIVPRKGVVAAKHVTGKKGAGLTHDNNGHTITPKTKTPLDVNPASVVAQEDLADMAALLASLQSSKRRTKKTCKAANGMDGKGIAGVAKSQPDGNDDDDDDDDYVGVEDTNDSANESEKDNDKETDEESEDGGLVVSVGADEEDEQEDNDVDADADAADDVLMVDDELDDMVIAGNGEDAFSSGSF